jgi:hypothetical protein
MKGKLLRMRGAKTDEAFSRTVPTVEADVNFDIRSVPNEDGTDRMCVIDLPNPGPQGKPCVAFLAPEHIDQLIAALHAWKALL